MGLGSKLPVGINVSMQGCLSFSVSPAFCPGCFLPSPKVSWDRIQCALHPRFGTKGKKDERMNEIVACESDSLIYQTVCFFILHTVEDLLNLSEATNVTVNQTLLFLFPNPSMLYWTNFRDRLSCLFLINNKIN